MKLGEITKIWGCTVTEPPDEDTTMIAKIGTYTTVGKVLDKKDKPSALLSSYICIKPLDKNQLLPDYLYHAMQYLHMQGYWKKESRLLLGVKYKIKISAVKDIEVGIHHTGRAYVP